jgi:nucleoid DNA-binding protein
MGVVRYTDLYQIVQDVCLLPLGKDRKVRNGKARHAVRAVFKAIVKGLKRDGFVRIQGFGVFRLNKVKDSYVQVCTNFKTREIAWIRRENSAFVSFKPCEGFRKEMRDGIQGTD